MKNESTPQTTQMHLDIRGHLLNALAALTGMLSGLFRYFEPMLKDAMGKFLQSALPIAEQLIISWIAGNSGASSLTDAGRNALASELMAKTKSSLQSLGIQITHGMALYALDTAFHSLKLSGKLPGSPTPSPATGN